MKKMYVYAAIAIFLWSTMATSAKLLLGAFNSMQVLMLASLFAFAFLLVVNACNGKLKKLKELRIKDFIQLFAIGLPGTFFYNLFYYLGTERMPASQAFIINYLWPIMSVVFACILLQERMTIKKGIAIGLSFVGVIIVTAGGGLGQLTLSTLLGAGFCALGAVCYGLFTALDKLKNYDRSISMMLYYFGSFFVALVYVLVIGEMPSPAPVEWLGLAWTGIGTYAMAYTCWALALSKGDTAKIANLAYITPFLSLVWTFLILDEPLRPSSVLGLVVIVFGILIQLKKENKTQTE